MSIYFFIRYGLAAILLVGWVCYQLIVKERKWSEIKGDAMAVVFFAAVWVALAYFFTS